jgi:hypothetical protein
LMLIHLQSHYLLHQRKALKLDFFDRYSWRLAFHISVLWQLRLLVFTLLVDLQVNKDI